MDNVAGMLTGLVAVLGGVGALFKLVFAELKSQRKDHNVEMAAQRASLEDTINNHISAQTRAIESLGVKVDRVLEEVS